MKRNLLLVLAMAAAWSAFGQETQGPNIVPNDGFEIDADGDGMPDDGWRLIVVSDDRFSKGALSAQAHSGKYCFCVECCSPKQ